MAWRDVRRRHKLIFRYEPILNLIEVKTVYGVVEIIPLDDYRPFYLRRDVQEEVDFEHIEGDNATTDDSGG